MTLYSYFMCILFVALYDCAMNAHSLYSMENYTVTIYLAYSFKFKSTFLYYMY